MNKANKQETNKQTKNPQKDLVDITVAWKPVLSVVWLQFCEFLVPKRGL